MGHEDFNNNLATPIPYISIKPASAFANTPYNGRQRIDASLIKFSKNDSKFGLATDLVSTRGGKLLNERIQTLDFRDIVINEEEVGNQNLINSFISAPVFLSKDNRWTLKDFDNNEIALSALDAHFGASASIDYFFNEFRRNSVDNKGMVLLNAVSPIVVNNEDELLSGHNAFWASSFDYDGTKYGMMAYFDGVDRGDGSTGDIGLVAGLDVLAHEVTHGVTEFTAGLKYQAESGALNEGISDIFGVNIKASVMGLDKNKMPEWSWLIGEPNFLIRDMSNPNNFGQPDTYKGRYWFDTAPDPITGYTQDNDNGGVHYNSGVLNYWYTLAVEGSGNSGPGKESPDLLIGAHENYTNDNGYVYRVKGIGMDKMQGVVYRALTRYLEPDSDFIDARSSTIKAAKDLTSLSIAKLYPGVPRLRSRDVSAIKSAWDAVGVGGGLAEKEIGSYSIGQQIDTVQGVSNNIGDLLG
ncbi:M4 family metallopeptidase [Cyanobium sp. T1G-Tous]|uniref:M4 family metallopeptidase n=1 Tax=Cyanobium sp. T1G-Tous TaxID=2823722 RepID=UPI0020CC5052|nr:M4 family metallopeptidase [Cyanobium sp. T1G-Tous]MCP9804757.1 M4 family metallopeptidase [Cyanobium sp. T1G-Tous]